MLPHPKQHSSAVVDVGVGDMAKTSQHAIIRRLLSIPKAHRASIPVSVCAIPAPCSRPQLLRICIHLLL